MHKVMFFEGLPSQIVVPMSKAPEGSAREQRDLEMMREMSSLNADVLSAIYLGQRGIQVAC